MLILRVCFSIPHAFAYLVCYAWQEFTLAIHSLLVYSHLLQELGFLSVRAWLTELFGFEIKNFSLGWSDVCNIILFLKKWGRLTWKNVNFLDDNLKSWGSGYLIIFCSGVRVKANYHSGGGQIAVTVTLVYMLKSGIPHIELYLTPFSTCQK